MEKEKQTYNMNPIQFGSNRFCGPSVISAITGLNTDAVVREVNKLRNKSFFTPVRGMYMHELQAILTKLDSNIKTEMQGEQYKRQSLFRLLFHLPDGLYILQVPGHFILIESETKDGITKKYILDNHTKVPINLGSSARLQQEVVLVVKVCK